MIKEHITDNKTKPKKDYLTTSELAKFCGVSRFTIRNWINQGKIRTIRTVGNQHRIPASEAISFLETLHLNGDTPLSQTGRPEISDPSKLISIPVLGGLHHKYVRISA